MDYGSVSGAEYDSRPKGKLLPMLVTILLTAIIAGGGTWYYTNAIEKSRKAVIQKQVEDLQTQIATLQSGNNSSAVSTGSASTEVVDAKIPASTFKYDKSSGYSGTLTLTGYLSHKTVQADPFEESSAETLDYVSFVFSKANTDLIDNFLSGNNGNSFVSSNSIGVGCYDQINNRIYSANVGDDGSVDNKIIGGDLQTLLSSSKNSEVVLQMTKPVYTSGMGAPACYSHFRDFGIIN